MSLPIPQPPPLPFIGNIREITGPAGPNASFGLLAKKYGEIFKFSMFGQERYIVSSVAMMDDLCNEKRWHKTLGPGLLEVRNGGGDGLFTAFEGEHGWELAHRILVPAFGPVGIKDIFDEMYDIATQLVAKWARMGDTRINATDDYTRLTLDSIALCTMDTRFNSFYRDEMHPFVDAMMRFLTESRARPTRTRLQTLLNPSLQRQYDHDINFMRDVASEVMAHRRANPVEKKDLLNAMLFGKDPKTGERMSDSTILNNMLTFLVAGHETTSGLLSFSTFYLIKKPEVLQKARKEVDDVVGKGPVAFHHMSKLPYLEAIMRESLRLHPTASSFAVTPKKDVLEPIILGGKYHIPKNTNILCLLDQIGRDPAAWGPNAEEFKPERMYGENFKNIPQNGWKVFGNGARSCIGRPFAWQEALLALALVVQNFNLRFDEPYELQIKETLTIKPDHFFMRATLRDGINPVHLEQKLFSSPGEEHATTKASARTIAQPVESTKPMTILYGSNSGTCEGLSQNLAGTAAAHGFSATVQNLDAATDQFPTDQPVVIITSSYEGQPPDNAAVFIEWLKRAEAAKFQGSQYAVFGCGHHDWVATYQKVPKLVDAELAEKGATRIAGPGESDVALGNVFDDFDQWQDNVFWPALLGSHHMENATIQGLEMELSSSARATHLRHPVQDALVLRNKLLTPTGVPEKRVTSFKLPTNLTYEAGDYLALLPVNDMRAVSRVLKHFHLPWDTVMTLKKGAHTTIPTETEIPVSSVLASYVELSTPATRKNLAAIAQYTEDDEVKASLSEWEPRSGETPSVLDILECHPDIQLPFSVYLSMLIPMRVRLYSISSSPLHDPTVASITYSLATDTENHLGVATHYLKNLEVGSTAQLTIKKSAQAFHIPIDPKTPIIMIGAGSGLAPFRGFIEQRAIQMTTTSSSGRNPKDEFGEAVLFLGCRHPDQDRIYTDELTEWEKLGAVKVCYAYSRAPERSEGCKYVQDRLLRERETVLRLFEGGAMSYICGSAALGEGVKQVVRKVTLENAERVTGKSGMTAEDSAAWWQGLSGERYAVDVFD